MALEEGDEEWRHGVLVVKVCAAAALAPSVSAAFNAAAKTNVVTYWGQGPNQDRLLATCQNPSYDIINIGFVNVFPDQGAGGWPGTNFGNACWGDVYENKGVNTSLLKTCPDIGPDVIECQQTYGKKIMLSIGGGYPVDYYIKNAKSGQKFADFLWAAFGPVSATKANIPRPWGDAGVDGFDFDIENIMDPAPQKNYQSSGYAAMINKFKNVHFPTDTTKSYYISGAPQCPIPDSHLSDVLASAWFDFFHIQFYNTPQCSARAAIQNANGNGKNDISYDTWTTQKSKNPNVKMTIGLPGSKTAAIDPSYYLTPAEAQKLVTRFYSNKKFGGIMVWEATAAASTTPCKTDYGTWMKLILTAKAAGKVLNTNIKTCAGVSKKKIRRTVFEHEVADLEPREAWSVSTCTETATHVEGGKTMVESYVATHTVYPTMPEGYYIPSNTAVVELASSSAGAYAVSSAAAMGYSSGSAGVVTNTVTAYKTVCPCNSASAGVGSASVSAPAYYGSSASSAQGITTTAVNTITIIAPSSTAPAGSATMPAAPYPVAPSGGSGNGTAWGTASASAAYPSSSGWVVPATGGAAMQGWGVGGLIAVGAVAVVLG
ncbi:Chitinase 2 [Saxophila tyrrhenica]|uniref:chitinase n=1 Tax=Saxophila tyrrhenica TaxID=1690608 RepID=A0AAV9P151_9PEZI|nr:Chitinase 2 [Saxophila tyrrhenica]